MCLYVTGCWREGWGNKEMQTRESENTTESWGAASWGEIKQPGHTGE